MLMSGFVFEAAHFLYSYHLKSASLFKQ